MKKLLIILFQWFLLIKYDRIHAQDSTNYQSNLIITINKNVIIGNLTYIRFNVIYKNGREEDIPLAYYPGCLSIGDEEYKKLIMDSIANIKLCFIHSKFIKEDQVSKEYEINYRLDYLKYRFFIVEIYDLDIKEYGYRYEKNKKRGEKYVYEMQTSNFQNRVIPSH